MIGLIAQLPTNTAVIQMVTELRLVLWTEVREVLDLLDQGESTLISERLGVRGYGAASDDICQQHVSFFDINYWCRCSLYDWYCVETSLSVLLLGN